MDASSAYRLAMRVGAYVKLAGSRVYCDACNIPRILDRAYRLAMRVGAYVKLADDGSRVYCDACNIPRILDRDSTNWNDLLVDIDTEIKLGPNHKLRVTYWDKTKCSYEEIDSDKKLLDAIDMYWEIRRLSLQVCVMKKDGCDSMDEIGRQQSMPCVLQEVARIWINYTK
ncbi:unnamed protein product [Urochloa humidicola]